MHVLRQVHRALAPNGCLLDIHPLGADFAIRAGDDGLGFVDTSKFRRLLEAMDEHMAALVAEGLFEELRTLRRHVVERYDNSLEALAEADSWSNLRLPAALRRRLQATDATPIEMIDTVRYRLLAKQPAA